jgi:glycogen(starch) synthase
VRIALLPSAYAPALGGVEELTHRLARRLVAAGDDVEIWTIRHPESLPGDELIDGLRVRRFSLPLPDLHPGRLARFPLVAGSALATLRSAARSFRPDVLHVQCFSANGVYATALAALLDVPLVVSLQGETFMDDGEIYSRSLSLRTGLRVALRRADAVTGCSSFVLDDAVRRFGLQAGTVVPNGVEMDGDAEPEPIDLPFDRFLLALGRVVPKKGFDLLLDAFARLPPGVGLVVGGDGPALAGLAARARELGVAGRVLLPGRLGRGQVAWAMARAEGFVLPSRVEPFGIVALEAMRAGRPVVVTPHGGPPEIVRYGRDGLVADPLDAEALAAALARLLDDEPLRARLAVAGPLRAAEFDWGVIAGRYRDIYRAAA